MPYLCCMAGSSEFLNHVPYLALVLCLALASGIYIGLAQWTRGIAHGQYNHKTAFQTISNWLKTAFVTVLLISLLRQALMIEHDEASYHIEMILLATLSFLFVLKRKLIHKENALQITENAAYFLKLTGLYCLFTGLLWTFLMCFFLLSLMLVHTISAALPLAINAFQVSVMATGLIALAPFHVWYKTAKAEAKAGRVKTPEHYRFHQILWPFIVALFLFILPLFMEKVATSDKFHEMMNAKPPLERV